MAELPTSGPGFGLTTINNAGATNALHNSDSHKQEPVVTVGNGATSTSNGGEYEHPEQPTEDVQRGVPNVEAVTITWSKRSLIALFILWNVPTFETRSLLTVIYIVANSISAISGAIWTKTFEKGLERNLPPASQSELVGIYNSLDVQLEYVVGSPTRLAIHESYGYAQARMLAAGTGIMGLALIWMFLFKNTNVAKIEQVKGMVFYERTKDFTCIS